MVEIMVDLPAGPTAVSADWSAGDSGSTVIIAHGAGTGKDHPFLTGFAEELASRGHATLRFNFPYVEQGRRMPGPAGRNRTGAACRGSPTGSRPTAGN